MTIKLISKKFEKRGYKVARDFNGKIIVQKYGTFSKSFDSYAQAYKNYFVGKF